jgi:signal transduction histidine kinase
MHAQFDSSPHLLQTPGICDAESTFKLSRRESETMGPLHLECTIIPIRGEGGILKERVLGIRNITERETEDRAKNDFLSLISHKLFTPLSVLQGRIALLKDGLLGELNEKQAKDVGSMVEQSAKLRGLIENLVNFVTLEGAAIDKSREEIDVPAFVGEIARDAQIRYSNKHAKVAVKLSEHADKIQFNRKYLQLITGELINNGLKFNLSDPATVEVEIKKDADNIVIAVSDNGIGIPPEFADRIFDKFFQIEKYFTGNVEGVGLGLSYVKRIVENFGGTIEAVSQPGKGSTFVVRI